MGGVKWMVRDGITGYVVPQDDIELLARSIVNHIDVKKMSEVAKEDALKQYHPHFVAEKTLKLYRSLLN